MKRITVILTDQQYKELVEIAPQDGNTPEGILKKVVDEAMGDKMHWQHGIPTNDQGVQYQWTGNGWR